MLIPADSEGGEKEHMMPLTNKRAETIIQEETLKRKPRSADASEEERVYRQRLREDVRQLRAAGIEIVIPADNPDAGEPQLPVA